MPAPEYFWPAAEDADLDEIFIENLPLFIAAEPKALAILKTSKEEDRTEKRWGLFLEEMPNLKRTTADRGKGIVGAISHREDLVHQSDIFHPKRLLGTELGKMEKRCYKLIAAEYDAQKRLDKTRAKGEDCRAASLRYRHACQKTRSEIERFDELAGAVNVAFDALRLTTADGRFNSPANARESLQLAKVWIEEHLPNGWSNVKNALDDDALLTFLDELQVAVKAIPVQSRSPQDRQYVLVTLARLWEEQPHRRHRGKPILVPQAVEEELGNRCGNLTEVKGPLFAVLDQLHRASSAVECINSRVGFYRYSKRRFSADFANLIGVRHNLTPFDAGKRATQCPAEILAVKLPTYDLFQLFGIEE